MIGYEWIGYGLMLTLVVALTGWVMSARVSSWLKLLLIAALWCRVLGSFLRHLLLFVFYDGRGDAIRYFEVGQEKAEEFAQLDFSGFIEAHGRWWGTHFLESLSGVMIWLIGPTMRGEFLLFGLLSLLGLMMIGFAVKREGPQVDGYFYLLVLLLWPSLWYWPASLGKDAIVLLGVGVAFAGYMGSRGSIRWPLLVAGFAIMFAIRPQVAALVATAIMMAHWLSFKGHWTPSRMLQAFFLLLLGGVVVWWGTTLTGITSFDVEGVQEYMAMQAGNTEGSGGSGIEAVGVGVEDIPMALITTFFRPFLWEAHNLLALVSSLEMVVLWGLVFYRHRQVMSALRNWRNSRALRFALPFVLMYSILLSMSVGNLGIIARQRIFVFPFLFILVAWEPARAKQRAARPVRRRIAATT